MEKELLNNIDLFVLDLDGTIYLGDTLIPGAKEFLDAVNAGFDVTVNFEKLERACAYIQKGAEFLAIHPDITCPMEYGAIPDCLNTQ